MVELYEDMCGNPSSFAVCMDAHARNIMLPGAGSRKVKRQSKKHMWVHGAIPGCGVVVCEVRAGCVCKGVFERGWQQTQFDRIFSGWVPFCVFGRFLPIMAVRSEVGAREMHPSCAVPACRCA